MPFNWNPLADAETHKAVAMDRRNCGLPTGKNAAGWQWKRPDPVKGSPGRIVADIRAFWDWTRSEALEDYRLAVFPERYEPMENIPF